MKSSERRYGRQQADGGTYLTGEPGGTALWRPHSFRDGIGAHRGPRFEAGERSNLVKRGIRSQDFGPIVLKIKGGELRGVPGKRSLRDARRIAAKPGLKVRQVGEDVSLPAQLVGDHRRLA